MLSEELRDRGPKSLSDFVHRDPRLSALAGCIPSTPNGLALPFVDCRVVEKNVLLDNSVPPRKLTLEMSIHVPCVQKEKVGFL